MYDNRIGIDKIVFMQHHINRNRDVIAKDATIIIVPRMKHK
jgi:hypothetical protein